MFYSSTENVLLSIKCLHGSDANKNDFPARNTDIQYKYTPK